MTTITLYHGTTAENYESIMRDGVLLGPVYMTPNKRTSEDYAANNSSNYMVFELVVDMDDLHYDSEFVCSHSVEESLEAGSVCVDSDVSISDARVSFYEDYEQVA